MATETKAAVLEPNLTLDGLSKQWIKAIVKEAMEEHELKTKLTPVVAEGCSDCSCKGQIQELTWKLNSLNARYHEDDKYALTKAKLITLMQKMGIE
jgi:hypothetical protein|tara:strand:- start:7882 stop:8169 length:288 start_codon:yes stop_codon:yes gene_type:complete